MHKLKQTVCRIIDQIVKLKMELTTIILDYIGGRLLKFRQEWNNLGVTYVLKAGAQANWISPLAPTLLHKKRHYSEFQGTIQKMKVYVKTLKVELDRGKVREVKDKEMIFYNKTFIIPHKNGRLSKIIDYRTINKYLKKNVFFQNENFQNTHPEGVEVQLFNSITVTIIRKLLVNGVGNGYQNPAINGN
ncbi:MAG: hypothetical protein EZS28_011647 [Streblomastix strix]|uniref:Uncharacterized protein n=1 Tax=Streblomastix strix TaxID=222440 RepID=A0A5J4WET7_9EUKA|nr:MAG: hypothetical protein EZS28_011647 [Streblomastix strix]